MQTELPQAFVATPEGARADSILRSCVHCGFCNATCPTYQVVGDELDGPRGRIYLMKEMLETQQVDPVAVRHLDRCLTCRACETTCPSGVAYGELLEISREFVADRAERGVSESTLRAWLVHVLPYHRRFRRWAQLGNLFRAVLPARLRAQLPRVHSPRPLVTAEHKRRVLVLQGCVQRVATPQANESLARLLDRRGVQVETSGLEGCCGALPLHLGDRPQALTAARALLDAVAPRLDEVEAVISSASGCGVTLKEYPRLLAQDPAYAALAQRFAAKLMDASEYLGGLEASTSLPLEKLVEIQRVAVQAPCTLQHGQRLPGTLDALLRAAGYELVPVRDPHLCCGSAGTYSLLQPELSESVRERKLTTLLAGGPDVIATANVGCQTHLAAASSVPVRHWLELVR